MRAGPDSPFSEDEIFEALMSCKRDTALGPNGFNMSLIQQIPNSLNEDMTLLFMSSVKTNPLCPASSPHFFSSFQQLLGPQT